MANPLVQVKRLPVMINPDPDRVITRFFSGDEPRARRRIERVLRLSECEVSAILSDLRRQYEHQDSDIWVSWLQHFEKVERLLPADSGSLTSARKLLIGAYFTMHYALEAAALFNPCIVPRFGYEMDGSGACPFILSLRAVGEGHLSSIVFRTGSISASNEITIDESKRDYKVLNAVENAEFETSELRAILSDLDELGPVEEEILNRVEETFSVAELTRVVEQIRADGISQADLARTKEVLLSLVGSNYRLCVPEGLEFSEIVLFPASANESRGIEDLRMVKFTDDDGSIKHYGTYTAYNGIAAFPTLLEVLDVRTIESHTLTGRYARNKGLALFPRKIGGKYVMSGRVDGENLYILESDNLRVWNDCRFSFGPEYWWEYAIVGNCGSPIETEKGWLLMTHGVGPMRQYCVSAALLDLDDPARVIGRLKAPLIMPDDDQCVGYVPNVVYTCGSMIHNGALIIPYAMSDMATTFACVDLDELLAALLAS